MAFEEGSGRGPDGMGGLEEDTSLAERHRACWGSQAQEERVEVAQTVARMVDNSLEGIAAVEGSPEEAGEHPEPVAEEVETEE